MDRRRPASERRAAAIKEERGARTTAAWRIGEAGVSGTETTTHEAEVRANRAATGADADGSGSWI